jgi:hypothetical protein
MLEPRVKEMNETKAPENRAYKVTLIVLVGLAAFSTAMRDLNRLKEVVSSVHEFTSQWQGTDSVALSENSSLANESCPHDLQKVINASDKSGSVDALELRGNVEMEKIECESDTDAEVGGKVELVASKKVKRNVAQLARANYAPARNLKAEISEMRRDGKWPTRFKYKTFDRTVTLDLPATMIGDIKSELESDASPSFTFGLLDKLSRKHSHIKFDNGKREFMIKRFERITNSRRSS